MIYTLEERTPYIANDAFVAPSATIIGDVHVHESASVWFGAVLRGDIERITVGRGSNVQDGTVMHTDPSNPCTLGEDVTVGHMAMLHGCIVGDNSLVGIGATLLNGSHIDKNTIVGAHTLITEGKEFPPGVLIMGTPGKIVRDLTKEEIAAITANSARYVKRSQLYRTELKPQ